MLLGSDTSRWFFIVSREESDSIKTTYIVGRLGNRIQHARCRKPAVAIKTRPPWWWILFFFTFYLIWIRKRVKNKHWSVCKIVQKTYRFNCEIPQIKSDMLIRFLNLFNGFLIQNLNTFFKFISVSVCCVVHARKFAVRFSTRLRCKFASLWARAYEPGIGYVYDSIDCCYKTNIYKNIIDKFSTFFVMPHVGAPICYKTNLIFGCLYVNN